MPNIFLQSWWVYALRGAFALLFGAFAYLRPDLTLLELLGWFASYALASGLVAAIGAVRHSQMDSDWWLMLLTGIAGVGASLVAVSQPRPTTLSLLPLIAAYAYTIGMLDIVTATRIPKAMGGNWLPAASGLAGFAFATLAFLYPEPGALGLLWLIGLYAFITGLLQLPLAYRARTLALGALHPRPTQLERRMTPDRRMALAH